MVGIAFLLFQRRGDCNLPDVFQMVGVETPQYIFNFQCFLMNISIRQAEPDEVALALSLFEEAALVLRAKGINQWQHWINPAPEYVNRVQKGFDDKVYFFVEQLGTLAGMFRLMDSDEEYWGIQHESAVYLHSFMTKPAFKGQDIGSTVIKLIEMKVREKGINYFRLDCKADNEALCNYYKRQGFVPIRLKVMPQYTVQLFEKKLEE
jgi:ribosomal protein S18 acetylase RimI-like enzyme